MKGITMAKRYYYEGENRTVYQIAKMHSIDREELRAKLKQGLPMDLAVRFCKKITK